jgi:hypothetical protein
MPANCPPVKPTSASSGRCRIIQAGRLTCVSPDNALIGVEFEPGEEHEFDCLNWKNKSGAQGVGYVVRTGDGDAYLMPHLFERSCEIIEDTAGRQVHQPIAKRATRPIRIVNVKGLNKPEQRANVVYVGRKFAGWPQHELHNPFKPVDGEPVGTCLARYKGKLLARLTLEEDLASLWEETGQGRKAIGCWCVTCVAGDGSEIVCHAQIVAEMLRERFGEK